jgi:hypothetical protein
MKVIVTKDAFGVSVWSADAVLTYEHLLSWRGKKAGVPVWSDTRSLFRSSRRLLKARKVKRMLPALGDDLEVGQSKACILSISRAND